MTQKGIYQNKTPLSLQPKQLKILQEHRSTHTLGSEERWVTKFLPLC